MPITRGSAGLNRSREYGGSELSYQAGFCEYVLPRLQGLQHKSPVQVGPCPNDDSVQAGITDDVSPVSSSLYTSGIDEPLWSHCCLPKGP